MRRLLFITFICLCILCAGFFGYFYPRIQIATGYAAKLTCSCIYLAGQQIEEATQTNLYHSILPYVHVENDLNQKSVSASFFGLQKQTAIFKEGVGCILMSAGEEPSFIYKRFDAAMDMDTSVPPFQWTEGVTQGLQVQKIQDVVDSAFDLEGGKPEKRTSAIIVIHRDTLVAEKYLAPATAASLQTGWSMTKSLMNAFVGLMVQNGKLDPSNNHLFREWDKDGRSNITLNDLLQMQSGLAWEEDYTKVSAVTRMLYSEPNVATIPLQSPATHAQGSYWQYSSGTTNLISFYIRNKFSNDEAYHSYIYRRLAKPIGMNSFIIETDVKGNYIGSSYGWATPRDWAKFGRLYLYDGVWQGKRLLPDYWVNYTRTPAEFSKGQYGAHFWLNKGHCLFKDAPEDMFFMDGYKGQFVFIIPSLDMIVVLMGSGDEHFDANDFLKGVISAWKK